MAGIICLAVAFPLFHISGILSNALLGYGSTNNHTPLDYLLGLGAIALGMIFIIRGASPPSEIALGSDGSSPYPRMAIYSILAPVALGTVILSLFWLYSIAKFSAETVVIDVRNVPDDSSVFISAQGKMWRTGGVNLGLDDVPKPSASRSWESHAEFVVKHPGFTTSTWAGQWLHVRVTLAAPQPDDVMMKQRSFELHLRRREEAGSSPIVASIAKATPCTHRDCYEMEVDFSSTAQTIQVVFDFEGLPLVADPN